MPKIRSYTSDAEINSAPLQATASDQLALGQRRAQNIRNNYTAAGALATNTGEIYEQYQLQGDIAKLTDRVASTSARLSTEWEDARNNIDPKDDEAASKFLNSRVAPALADMGEGLKTRKGREAYRDRAASIQSDMYQKIHADVTTVRGAYAVNSLNEHTNQMAIKLYKDPTALASVLALNEKTIASVQEAYGDSLDAGDALKLLRDMNATSVKAQIAGAVKSIPGEDPNNHMNRILRARAELASGTYDKYLSAEDMASIDNDLDVEMDKQNALNELVVSQQAATEIFSQYRDRTLSEAIEQVPYGKQHASMVSSITAMFAVQEKEDNDTKENAYNGVVSEVVGGKPLAQVAEENPDAVALVLRGDPARVQYLKDRENDRLKGEVHPEVADPAFAKKLLSMDPRDFIALPLASYADKLPKTEYDQQVARQEKLRVELAPDGPNGSAFGVGQAAIKETFGTTKPGAKDYDTRIARYNNALNMMYDRIDAGIVSGSKMSKKEIDEYAQLLMVKAYSPGWLGPVDYFEWFGDDVEVPDLNNMSLEEKRSIVVLPEAMSQRLKDRVVAEVRALGALTDEETFEDLDSDFVKEMAGAIYTNNDDRATRLLETYYPGKRRRLQLK